MPAQQSSSVPDGPLHISIRRCVAYRQRLRSPSGHEVSITCHRLSTFGRQAFAVAGPTVWNSLPEDMQDPEVSEDGYSLRRRFYLCSTSVFSA